MLFAAFVVMVSGLLALGEFFGTITQVETICAAVALYCARQATKE